MTWIMTRRGLNAVSRHVAASLRSRSWVTLPHFEYAGIDAFPFQRRLLVAALKATGPPHVIPPRVDPGQLLMQQSPAYIYTRSDSHVEYMIRTYHDRK